MSLHAHFDPLVSFLAQIAHHTGRDRSDAFFRQAMETGGTVTGPDPSNWSAQVFEISLHGIHAIGSDAAEAERNWIKAATRQASATDTPERKVS